MGEINPTTKVLDFGCGVGRIAMPLYHEHRYPTHAVDVSPWCVGYLKRQLTETDVRQTGNLPPLPFESDSFDAVYSISVWTHLPLERQWPWLREVNRVLKPGGIALISTSGTRALRYRREERQQPGWIGVTDEDLQLEGVIYKDCDPKNHDGVEGAYGYVAHDPEWIRREWGRLFDYVDFLPAAVFGMQDINVLRKVKDVKPSDLTLIGNGDT
jgi:SAM-dependent methyltransferase